MPKKPKSPSVADENTQVGAASVNRALSILAVFQKSQPRLSLSEIAEQTKLYKSTVLRLLSSLISANFVQRFPDDRYGLNYEVARLYEVYRGSFSLEQVVQPELQDLVSKTGESAAYHVRQGDMRLCLYRVDSPHPIRDHIKVGDVLPLNRGAGGRVLVAYSAEISQRTNKDEQIYQQIREQGYFAGIGDRDSGVGGISAPVFDTRGHLAGAITLTMPAERFNEQFITAVIEASRRLGARI
ncbi:IclR family transcriptional regulator [Pusillimonas sp. DMV24BSW_D]|uniref:IclR family transcriptional regulator n=1 Tax=Neopusillimonas aestuarii TaxID=2716226 RepID=UPI000C5B4BA4|nr:IclR family transcriptional regulator [Pusillimonas sp. DMV24BSW_D]MBF24111.1 IclR family transcriptional regulator [Pusillimonas sp.]QIM48077.1 IclR family transcriptional regulator [Pusillimonas sp. DMV24BSW_D]|tara:strand:+ start:18455 stop:19177 length:723 start_codon:yes stop_codon:yes gene_type:complete